MDLTSEVVAGLHHHRATATELRRHREAAADVKPCLDCGWLVPSGSRCTRCATEVGRAKRATRPYTAAERDRRAAAVAEWRAQYGDVCPGWQREPHPSTDLTADHVVPVAAGGVEGGPLRVLCRRCNSARGARP